MYKVPAYTTTQITPGPSTGHPKAKRSQRISGSPMRHHLLTDNQMSPPQSTQSVDERSFGRVPSPPLITPVAGSSDSSDTPSFNATRYHAAPPSPFLAYPRNSPPRAPGLHLTLENESNYTQDSDRYRVSLLSAAGPMPTYPALELPVGNPISIIAMNQTLRRMQHELNEATNALQLARSEQERCVANGTGLDLVGKRGNDAELNKVRQEVMRLEEVGRQLRDAMWGIRRTLEVAERESGDVWRRMNDAGQGHVISKDNDAGQVTAGGVAEEDPDWDWDPEAF